MTNPGRKITYQGRTMILKEWARELGIKRVTLGARLRKGFPLEKCFYAGNLRDTPTGYRKRGLNYEHRLIAERAIGKPLPPRALVHHVDGDPTNNTPTNLVVCPNDAYHRLLHMRQEALDATGDPSARRCAYCKEWGRESEIRINSKNAAYHRECHNEYHRALRARLRRRRNNQ